MLRQLTARGQRLLLGHLVSDSVPRVGRVGLFDAIEDQVADDDEALLVRGLGELGGQSHGLLAVLAGQQPRLLQTLGLVDQLKCFFYVSRLLEAPHDHRVQFGVLKTNHNS